MFFVSWELSFKCLLHAIRDAQGLKFIASIKLEIAISLLISADMQRCRIETRVNRNVLDCLKIGRWMSGKLLQFLRHPNVWCNKKSCTCRTGMRYNCGSQLRIAGNFVMRWTV